MLGFVEDIWGLGALKRWVSAINAPTDIEARGRIKALRRTAFAFACVLVVYMMVIFSIMPGIKMAKLVTLALAVIFLVIAALTDRVSRLAPAVWVFIAVAIVGGVAGSIQNGGIEGNAVAILIIAPLAAGYFLGGRAAVIATSATVAALTLLYWLGNVGLVTPTPYPPEATRLQALFLLSMATILGAIAIYAFTQEAEESKRNLKAASEHAQSTMAQIVGFFDISLDLLCVADLEGRFIQVSTAFEEVLGHSRGEMEGQSFALFVHPEDLAKSFAALSEVGAGNDLADFVARVRRVDGSYRSLEWRARTARFNSVIYAAARDITDRIARDAQLEQAIARLEQAMQQAEWANLELYQERETLEVRVQERTASLEAASLKAEAASKAKSQFLANMSHELRTPLSSIKSYAEMLREGAEEENRDVDIKDLNVILGAADHLLVLISDLLNMSKIEAGKMELDLTTFDLAVTSADLARQLRPVVEKQDNTFTVVIDPALGEVHTDALKLKQSVLNLLSNAAKFTKQGNVTLSLAAMERGERAWIDIAVTDTGIGMSPAQMANLFSAFSQADASTTRHYGGTGLGLSISKAFAELLGGTLEVESVEGAGTTFRMRIPADWQARDCAEYACGEVGEGRLVQGGRLRRIATA